MPLLQTAHSVLYIPILAFHLTIARPCGGNFSLSKVLRTPTSRQKSGETHICPGKPLLSEMLLGRV